jgi:hypothetical protein
MKRKQERIMLLDRKGMVKMVFLFVLMLGMAVFVQPASANNGVRYIPQYRTGIGMTASTVVKKGLKRYQYSKPVMIRKAPYIPFYARLEQEIDPSTIYETGNPSGPDWTYEWDYINSAICTYEDASCNIPYIVSIGIVLEYNIQTLNCLNYTYSNQTVSFTTSESATQYPIGSEHGIAGNLIGDYTVRTGGVVIIDEQHTYTIIGTSDYLPAS